MHLFHDSRNLLHSDQDVKAEDAEDGKMNKANGKPRRSKIIEFNVFDLIKSDFILHTWYITIHSLKITQKFPTLQNRW